MIHKPGNSLRLFIIYTFLLFWVLLRITGALVYSNVPQITFIIMKIIWTWSSTFVLIILFKKLFPGETITAFLKKQFSKVSWGDFAVPFVIQLVITVGAVILFTMFSGEKIGNIQLISVSALLPLLLVNITSGPMGEELGWRAYALNELQKKHSPLVAALIIGLMWGLWHFPFWILTGLTGTDLLLYILSFLVGIISFSVFMTHFYNKSKNILVAVWMHFLFNIFMQIAIIEDFRLITVVSAIYLVVTCGIVLVDKTRMLRKPEQ